MASRVITFQSLPYTWAASSNLFVDLSFLNPARSMKAPVVTDLRIRFSGTIDTGSSGGPARCFPNILSQVRVADIAGDRVNLRGSSLRVVDQMEYGVGYTDGNPTATVAATQTAASIEYYQRIPFSPYKCSRRADYGMPLREFLDGGVIQLTTNAALIATNFQTTKTGTLTLYADICDEGYAEAKSRICWFDQAIPSTEFNYNVAGLARWLAAYNGEINERVATRAPTGWSSQTITSKTLELSAVQDTFFVDQYKTESRPRIAGPGVVATAEAGVTEDTFANLQAIPFLNPDYDQSVSSLPQMATVHYKTSLSSITTTDLPQMIVCAITERSDAATGRTLGADWRSRLDRGVVAAADGNHRSIKAFAPGVQKFLPLRLM